VRVGIEQGNINPGGWKGLIFCLSSTVQADEERDIEKMRKHGFITHL